MPHPEAAGSCPSAERCRWRRYRSVFRGRAPGRQSAAGRATCRSSPSAVWSRGACCRCRRRLNCSAANRRRRAGVELEGARRTRTCCTWLPDTVDRLARRTAVRRGLRPLRYCRRRIIRCKFRRLWTTLQSDTIAGLTTWNTPQYRSLKIASHGCRFILSGAFCPVYIVWYILSGYILSDIFCPVYFVRVCLVRAYFIQYILSGYILSRFILSRYLLFLHHVYVWRFFLGNIFWINKKTLYTEPNNYL